MSVEEKEFSPLRAFFWPIYRHELKKVLPMMMMLFLICFNYSILRNAKNTLVVTAQSSGAEVIPFIKVWVLLPTAILLTIIFTKLSNRLSQEKVFYVMISGFLLFFALFTYVFYPLRDVIHPHQTADLLTQILPVGFKGLIAMFRNWSFTVFYVISELWGSIVLHVLFWGFANEITKITEARRFYSMLGVISSLSGTVAGVGANFLSSGHWEQSLQLFMSAILIAGCLTMAIFYWMNKTVLNTPHFNELHHELHPQEPSSLTKQIKIKKKLSIRESLSYLANSKYLICIAILVLSYNLVINLVEIVWQDQLYQLYTNAEDYNHYLNNVTSLVGVLATLLSLFIPRLIERFGWTGTALITPLMILLTSIGFFTFMLFKNDLIDPVFALTGTTPLAIAIFFGATQICLSKACKYSVFDSTKEMAFIPLSHESKLKGKAAIDGIGSRLGKSGGSLIHQGLLLIFATVSTSASYVALILFVVVLVWIVATRSLGKQFVTLVGEQGRKEMGEVNPIDDSTLQVSKI
jgi:AAA family ATP:ADP antiporter